MKLIGQTETLSISHFIQVLLILNQVHTSHMPAYAWFLKIDPVRIIGMRVCVCVSTPKAINN